MSEELQRAPNPRATPTMQASNRLTFKFWTMLTARCLNLSFSVVFQLFCLSS